MAFSESDLSAIRTAIAKGELEVQFGDRRVRYRSIEELIKAERHIADELLTTAGRPRQFIGTASKGLC